MRLGSNRNKEIGSASETTKILSLIRSNLLLFFPEIIPAVVVAIVSPSWLVSLLLDGHFIAALVLLSGVTIAIMTFVIGLRAKSKYIAYTGVLVVLVASYVAYTLDY